MEPDCDNNNDDKMSCLSADTDEQNTLETKTKKPRKPRVIQAPLKSSYTEDKNIFEIGVDEVGRGPLFGRVYTAAVILPKDGSFDCSMFKDSKKFNSIYFLAKCENLHSKIYHQYSMLSIHS